MPNPMIRIHNTETDEVIDREMTADEFAVFQEQKAIDAAKQQAAAEKAAAKAAIADRLGLTQDELALLLA